MIAFFTKNIKEEKPPFQKGFFSSFNLFFFQNFHKFSSSTKIKIKNYPKMILAKIVPAEINGTNGIAKTGCKNSFFRILERTARKR